MKATKQQEKSSKKNNGLGTEKNTNILEVDLKDYGECGWCLSLKETLRIPWKTWLEWKYISQSMESREWGAVLLIKDGTLISYQIPKQEVTSGDCEFKEELGGNGIVHSHHTMGAFHSHQDDKHARNLYEYSIVLSSTGYVATKKTTLPCGGKGHVNVDLVLFDIPDLGMEKITEKKYKQPETFQLNHAYVKDKEESLLTVACDNCMEFNCRDCKEFEGQKLEGELPFCFDCDEYNCDRCWKLEEYQKHYPETEWPL